MSRLSRRYVIGKFTELRLAYTVRPPREAFAIPGYLRDIEGRFLYWLAGRVPPGGRALEVGSFKGRSSVFISAGLPRDARLACVDTWRNDAMPYDASADALPEFERNVSPYRHRIDILRGRSAEVAGTWKEPVDLLFIDGDHSYEGCRDDIIAWRPFVKAGGMIAFHDSSEVGVARAVDEYIPRRLRRRERYAWSIFAFRCASAA